MAKTNSIISKKDAKINGVIIVDDINGNDLTGEKYNLAKPFKTIQKSIEVYTDGDEIQVKKGDYIITSSIELDSSSSIYIDIVFEIGSKVLGSINDVLFISTSGSRELHIYGYGIFRNDNSIVSSRLKVYGAKEFSSISNPPLGTRMLLAENIELLYSQNEYAIKTNSNSSNVDVIVRNIKQIGKIDAPYGVQTGTNNGNTITFENCNIISSVFCLFGVSIGLTKFINCNFEVVGSNRQVAFNGGNIEYHNCYFENNATAPTLNILYDKVKLFNCRINNKGTGKSIETRVSVQWNGVNYCVGTLSSNSDVNQFVNGTIFTNQEPIQFGLQFFQIGLDVATTPTAGDFWYIDSPDGSQIEYEVQLGDTNAEIINGLFNAWVSKADELNNDFANFVPSFVDGPAVFYIKSIAIDDSFTMAQDNGFIPTTTGTDPFTTFTSESLGFTTVGGNLRIDENLSL